MSRTPINPKRLRSRRSLEEVYILREAWQALAAVFFPFLAVAVHERLRTHLETPVPFASEDRAAITEFCEVLRGERSAFSDPVYAEVFQVILTGDSERQQFFRDLAQSGELDAALADVEKELRDPVPVSEERLNRHLLQLAHQMTVAWIGILLGGMERDSSVCFVDEALLGPGIAKNGLPPLPHPEPECDGFSLTSDEFLAVLGRVKASLPKGKLLPDPAMTVLSMHGVRTVIQIKHS